MIQKALLITSGEEKDCLVAAVNRCIPTILDKKIRKKWEKIIVSASDGTTKIADE